jgi:hypothetical protein
MSERPDDATARQQRLAALRKLAGEQPQSVSAEPQPTTAPHPAQPGPAVGQRIGAVAGQPASGARRWRTVALISLATLVIVGVFGAALWQRGTLFGQPGARSAAALSVKVFTVSGAAGVYCSSTPAWSPDSKSIAVFGQTNPPTDTCVPYNPQLALIATGISSSQSVNHADGYALVTLDSATGHIRQRITLPTPDQSALCGGASPCAIENPNVQSLAWSPDGRSVAIFFTYERMTGAVNVNSAQGIQECGGLLIVPVGGAASAAPRLLLAAAAGGCCACGRDEPRRIATLHLEFRQWRRDHQRDPRRIDGSHAAHHPLLSVGAQWPIHPDVRRHDSLRVGLSMDA